MFPPPSSWGFSLTFGFPGMNPGSPGPQTFHQMDLWLSSVTSIPPDQGDSPAPGLDPTLDPLGPWMHPWFLVFTLVTRGRFLTSASKFNIEPNGGIFDVSAKNERASPNVKSPSRICAQGFAEDYFDQINTSKTTLMTYQDWRRGTGVQDNSDTKVRMRMRKGPEPGNPPKRGR